MVKSNPTLCQNSNDVKLNLYKFGYAIVKSDWNGAAKNPTYSRIYYIIDGSAYIEYDNKRITLTRGNWYLIPAGLSFVARCEDKMEHLYFHLTLSGDNEIDLLSEFSEPHFFADNTNPHIFYKKFLESKSLFAAITIKQNIYQIILKFMELTSIKPKMTKFSPCIEKAVAFINNNLFRKLNLSTIANYVHVSKSTLTTKFKNELKITIQEYIQSQKMSKAEEIIKNSDMAISEISERLGFSDQFYFSRCFKQSFGISPREYRKTKIN